MHPRLTDAGAPGSLFVCELKLENINESLWDAYKLLWLAESAVVGPQFVAVAATDAAWANGHYGGTLYPARADVTETRSSTDLIGSCQKRWCWQWRRDTAKPLRIPSAISVTSVLVGHRPQHFPALELRIARIAAASPAKLELVGGVPRSLSPC